MKEYWDTGTEGAETGALRDKTDGEQQEYAFKYYDAIRNRKYPTDIQKIAKNTGFSEENISLIRNHIFIEKHDLGEGKIDRFFPYWRIAQAWSRLEQNKGTDHDILLLNHELDELTIMRERGYNYPKAHELADEKYPWDIEIKKEE
jgi:hypothetical protein